MEKILKHFGKTSRKISADESKEKETALIKSEKKLPNKHDNQIIFSNILQYDSLPRDSSCGWTDLWNFGNKDEDKRCKETAHRLAHHHFLHNPHKTAKCCEDMYEASRPILQISNSLPRLLEVYSEPADVKNKEGSEEDYSVPYQKIKEALLDLTYEEPWDLNLTCRDLIGRVVTAPHLQQKIIRQHVERREKFDEKQQQQRQQKHNEWADSMVETQQQHQQLESINIQLKRATTTQQQQPLLRHRHSSMEENLYKNCFIIPKKECRPIKQHHKNTSSPVTSHPHHRSNISFLRSFLGNIDKTLKRKNKENYCVQHERKYANSHQSFHHHHHYHHQETGHCRHHSSPNKSTTPQIMSASFYQNAPLRLASETPSRHSHNTPFHFTHNIPPHNHNVTPHHTHITPLHTYGPTLPHHLSDTTSHHIHNATHHHSHDNTPHSSHDSLLHHCSRNASNTPPHHSQNNQNIHHPNINQKTVSKIKTNITSEISNDPKNQKERRNTKITSNIATQKSQKTELPNHLNTYPLSPLSTHQTFSPASQTTSPQLTLHNNYPHLTITAPINENGRTKEERKRKERPLTLHEEATNYLDHHLTPQHKDDDSGDRNHKLFDYKHGITHQFNLRDVLRNAVNGEGDVTDHILNDNRGSTHKIPNDNVSIIQKIPDTERVETNGGDFLQQQQNKQQQEKKQQQENREEDGVVKQMDLNGVKSTTIKINNTPQNNAEPKLKIDAISKKSIEMKKNINTFKDMTITIKTTTATNIATRSTENTTTTITKLTTKTIQLTNTTTQTTLSFKDDLNYIIPSSSSSPPSSSSTSHHHHTMSSSAIIISSSSPPPPTLLKQSSSSPPRLKQSLSSPQRPSSSPQKKSLSSPSSSPLKQYLLSSLLSQPSSLSSPQQSSNQLSSSSPPSSSSSSSLSPPSSSSSSSSSQPPPSSSSPLKLKSSLVSLKISLSISPSIPVSSSSPPPISSLSSSSAPPMLLSSSLHLPSSSSLSLPPSLSLPLPSSSLHSSSSSLPLQSSSSSQPSSSSSSSSSSQLPSTINNSTDTASLSCYHGSLSRAAAEELLGRDGGDGSYLVRRSESCKKDYSLSLKSGGTFLHMRIEKDLTNHFILGEFSQPFLSIPLIISFFTINQIPIRGNSNIRLTTPVIKKGGGDGGGEGDQDGSGGGIANGNVGVGGGSGSSCGVEKGFGGDNENHGGNSNFGDNGDGGEDGEKWSRGSNGEGSSNSQMGGQSGVDGYRDDEVNGTCIANNFCGSTVGENEDDEDEEVDNNDSDANDDNDDDD